MQDLNKQYRDLEIKVMRELRDRIECSTHISKHINDKAIKVNLFDYEEMAIIHDRLTFIDRDGYQADIYSESDLVDLIDILNQ